MGITGSYGYFLKLEKFISYNKNGNTEMIFNIF